MPTITLQVGQCGNQLGNTFWSLLERQHGQLVNSLAFREWFNQCASSSDTQPVLRRRVVSIDSEAKVAQSLSGALAPHQQHILGHGGCGNNWACGYHFGVSSTQNKAPVWSSICAEHSTSRVDTVLEGIRKEAEAVAGVSDFLLIGSLAGGTGSGTGSALLEALADEYPASTLAAVGVVPSRTGDTTVQSINSCLAMQHLAMHAHAVILIDNQALLEKLDQLQLQRSSMTSCIGAGSSSSRIAQKRTSSQGAADTPNAADHRKACLDGVNHLASESLLGLLWSLSTEDSLCGRSSIRRLAATICADPVCKFVEVCHLAQPATAWSSMAVDPWPARVKLLSAQLPKFDPHSPSQPVTTSAAFLIMRGIPGTAVSEQAEAGRNCKQLSMDSSCWSTLNSCWAGNSVSIAGWQDNLYKGVCSSWPGFVGGKQDIHIGSSMTAHEHPSMTAAVRRSSIGNLMHAAADRSLQLCQAGAYMHWYEQYGCSREEVESAAYFMADHAMPYLQ